MIYYLAPAGLCGIENYIGGRWRAADGPEVLSLPYEEAFGRRTLPSGTFIFAGVEQLPPAGQLLADLVWQALTQAGQRALNRPALLPTRHGLLERLYREGVNNFRSHRVDDIGDDIRYPVFVRRAEQHDGSLSGLLADRAALDSFLGWQRLRGFSADELLVVEFCDTGDSQGEYRKYSAQCVNGLVSARYLHVDTHWMVKAHGSTWRDEWAAQEIDYIRGNPHATELADIFARAGVDFGRVDYGLQDGVIRVWEINTNPTMGGPPPGSRVQRTPEPLRQLQKPGKEIFYERFHAMLESISAPRHATREVPLALPDAALARWRRERRDVRGQERRRQMFDRLAALPGFRQAGRWVRQIHETRRGH